MDKNCKQTGNFDDDMPNGLLTKRQICKYFYKYVKDENYYNSVEYLEKLLDCLNCGIGVHGSIFVPFIGSEIEAIKEIHAYRNRRSQRLFIKWLLSEMRDYLEYGTLNTYIKAICERSFRTQLENLKKRR